MILLDVDGVVADIHGPLLKHHGLRMEDWVPGEYWFEKAFGIPTEGVFKNLPADFWSDAPKLPWADELVELCLSISDVCFLTKPTDAECARDKVIWLRRHYPKVPYLIGPSKKFCAAPGRTLVDDCDANVDEFVHHGGRGVLFPRVWNRGHKVSDPFAHVRSVL